MTKEKAIDILDDDVISGESVKDIRRALLFYGDHFMSCNQINRFFNRFLKIEKPKTGYWREVDVNVYACSNCNRCFSIVPEDNSIEEYKYCPNCKTKMIDSQTERDDSIDKINNIKYMVCCPMCDNEKCVRKTDKCEAEIWAKSKVESEE